MYRPQTVVIGLVVTAILVGIGFAVGYFVRGGTRHSGQGDQGDQGEEINRLNNLLDDVQKKLDDALEREQNLTTENATLNSQLLALANRGNGSSSKGSSKGKLPLLPVAIGGGVGIFVIAVIVNLLSKGKQSATFRGAAAFGSGTRRAGSTVVGGLGAGLGAAGGAARSAGSTVIGGLGAAGGLARNAGRTAAGGLGTGLIGAGNRLHGFTGRKPIGVPVVESVPIVYDESKMSDEIPIRVENGLNEASL